MATPSRVALVVVTYNGRDLVEDCLASLSDGPARVMVVDNASADGTVDFIRQRFPLVEVLALDANAGYGEACNRAIAGCGEEYIAVLNQDAVALPGWLDHLVSALDADPAAALATPKILLRRQPDRINACGNSPHFSGITPCRGFNADSAAYGACEQVAAISGAAFVVRRSALEAMGGFDARFFMYFEDTDLSLRAYLAGFHCLYVSDATVLHDFEPRFSAAKLYLLERNRHLSWLKIFRWRTLGVLAPALLLIELLVFGYSLLRGPRCALAKVRAWAAVLRAMPALLAARRGVQATRRAPDAAILARCGAELDVDELSHGAGSLVMAAVNPFFRLWFSLARALVAW